MVRTLRARLILSHMLPLLVIIPLIGLALVYLLESLVVLPSLAAQVQGEGQLVADLASGEPIVWIDPRVAKAFVSGVAQHLTERIMLIDESGILVASSDAADAGRVGAAIQADGLDTALQGHAVVHRIYSMGMRTDIVDVLTPVIAYDGRVLGVVRLSHSLSNVYDRFVRQRYLIAVVLLAALLVGGAVGWLLALNVERPLRRVTRAVAGLARGEQGQTVPEQGPDEVRLLAQSYNSLVERLASMEQARRQLVANLVHELGRPLGALHSAIQALQGGADEQEELRHELLAGMDGEVSLLRHLLDDLARLRDEIVGQLELNLCTVSVNEWLPQALASWREAALAKGVHWESQIAADLPPVQIDPDRLAQAIGNLVSNAIKYTSAGGNVVVSAGQERGALWIRVSDTGPGIPAEEQERIFTPFYRRHSGRRFPQGMGLGLTIARAVVLAHGGRVDLSSTPGLGSNFTIRLPLT